MHVLKLASGWSFPMVRMKNKAVAASFPLSLACLSLILVFSVSLHYSGARFTFEPVRVCRDLLTTELSK